MENQKLLQNVWCNVCDKLPSIYISKAALMGCKNQAKEKKKKRKAPHLLGEEPPAERVQCNELAG